MASELTITPALSDALTILGAAGIVIPAFARLRINPVIGFIVVGIIAGPFGLGALVGRFPWLEWLSASPIPRASSRSPSSASSCCCSRSGSN